MAFFMHLQCILMQNLVANTSHIYLPSFVFLKNFCHLRLCLFFHHALLTRWGKNRLEGPALQLVTFVPLLLCRDDRLQRLLRVYRPPRLEVHQ